MLEVIGYWFAVCVAILALVLIAYATGVALNWLVWKCFFSRIHWPGQKLVGWRAYGYPNDNGERVGFELRIWGIPLGKCIVGVVRHVKAKKVDP